MIRFERDYCEGAHPEVMNLLMETNMEQTTGYGEDEYCKEAAEIIKKLCAAPDADVHFLVGGTQTNTTVIASILRPYQGVLSADTGHINCHETGAIEATGHMVLPLANTEGKISAAQVKAAYDAHWNDETHEHLVQPGMVYISHPTEFGTLYTKTELTELYKVCRECGLPLFVDGARLGYGLMSPETDVTLEDMAKLCDVFYIGGTKVGALFGEAVVITNSALKRDFRYSIKRHGGMLAKGRLLGIQFLALMRDGLYFEISKKAVDLALKVRDTLRACNVPVLMESPTNQQFPIFTDEQLKKLEEKYCFSLWETFPDGRKAVRICTSWASVPEQVYELIKDIYEICGK